MKQTLGTQLRHLIELLDGAVSAAYDDAGLDWRPRYTPVVRALMQREPLTIGQIADIAGLTQPATTQTIALMAKEGLVSTTTGPKDARQRLIHLTELGRGMLPELTRCWQATAAAAASLEAELPASLNQTLASAIAALEARPYGQRIRDARAQMAPNQPEDENHTSLAT